MNPDLLKMFLGSALRHGATGAGAWLIKAGLLDNNGATQFVGAVMFLGGIGWSFWQKYGHAMAADMIKKMTTAKVPAAGPIVKILIAAFLLSAFLAPRAFAADVATKAINNALSAGYPTTKCGMYYGFGTGGSSGQVEDAAVGTRIVQGELDAILGYSCPFGTAGFWFVEGSVGVNNVNGNVNGLAMSGPLVIMQRAGAGSPLNALFNPFGNSLALPSVPLLPAGVTSGAATPYFFAGLVEQDIATQLGLGAHSHQWLVAPMLGIGLLTRLNGNASVVDTWAGWQMNSQSFCPGGGQACGKLGNAVRVGVSFKY